VVANPLSFGLQSKNLTVLQSKFQVDDFDAGPFETNDCPFLLQVQYVSSRETPLKNLQSLYVFFPSCGIAMPLIIQCFSAQLLQV
jgi:hypothetical protein